MKLVGYVAPESNSLNAPGIYAAKIVACKDTRSNVGSKVTNPWVDFTNQVLTTFSTASGIVSERFSSLGYHTSEEVKSMANGKASVKLEVVIVDSDNNPTFNTDGTVATEEKTFQLKALNLDSKYAFIEKSKKRITSPLHTEEALRIMSSLFSATEVKDIDTDLLIGKTVSITVEKKTSTSGTDYMSVTRVRKQTGTAPVAGSASIPD